MIVAQHVLLILGSMDEFVQLVEDSKARGFRTLVADGYADGPAKAFADAAFDIAVDDTETLAKLCADEKVDGLITAYSDVLFENMVKLSARTGIPCYGNYAGMQWLRSKTRMKQMFDMQGIPYPKSQLLQRADDLTDVQLKFPCVMKPRDGYGSRGIFVVDGPDEVRQKFDTTLGFCMNEPGVILEEYCTGYEFNMITWVSFGRVHVVSIADREKSHEIKGDVPHVSRLVYPSRFWDQVGEDARDIVQKVAVFAGIQNGPLCMQFFWSPEDGVKVCECAGRVFGYEHELVEISSGLRIEDLLLDTAYDQAALHERLEGHDLSSFTGAQAGLYFHGREERIGDMAQADAFIDQMGSSVLERLWYYQSGDEVSHGRGAKPYVLRLYVQFDDVDGLDAATRELFKQLCVEGESGHNILYHNEVPDYF